MTMPFGKYRGLAIERLPDDYLAWLLRKVDLYDPLLDAVTQEYDRRFTYGSYREKDRPRFDDRGREQDQRYRQPTPIRDTKFVIRLDPESVPLAQRMFDVGYRSVALTLHPDTGGNGDAMTKLNLLAKSIREQLDSLEVTR